ncbi:hypothetical protein O2W18_04925 [Modestobacter sp. VKM Ac-2983]|uniref:hypothetical protein n=1 Tax=Modestobacter sp. VKM Ac-2983 TaxID=3004137 RepID=UPI0022ABA025|nr:hypothetical protein [Modestobacter sp. VKM Ac-2983]MCZ2804437.1 hypothetical protein [Modestobacter sp. VKM Ac-2983]
MGDFISWWTTERVSVFLGPALIAAVCTLAGTLYLKKKDQQWREEDKKERAEERAFDRRERAKEGRIALAKLGPSERKMVLYAHVLEWMQDVDRVIPAWGTAGRWILERLDEVIARARPETLKSDCQSWGSPGALAIIEAFEEHVSEAYEAISDRHALHSKGKEHRETRAKLPKSEVLELSRSATAQFTRAMKGIHQSRRDFQLLASSELEDLGNVPDGTTTHP